MGICHASLKDLMGGFLPNNIWKQNKVYWHNEIDAFIRMNTSVSHRSVLSLQICHLTSRPSWIYWTEAKEEKLKVLIPGAEDCMLSTVWATCVVSCKQCTWAWTIMMAPLTIQGKMEKLLFLFRRIVIKAHDKSVEGHEKLKVQRDGRFWCGPLVLRTLSCLGTYGLVLLCYCSG